MGTPLDKYAGLDDAQLAGMMTYTGKTFPFVDKSSLEALQSVCGLMLTTQFMFDQRPTPIKASFDFLCAISKMDVQGQPTGRRQFVERDFVYAVKMFGLRVRVKNGVYQFMPENELDFREDEEVLIDDERGARQVEFYISSVQTHTKIQTHTIESAYNKLMREWRERELARVFADKIRVGRQTIGQAREFLRTECGIKDHEFVRIREHAINMGIFQSKRSAARGNRRVTLDEDVAQYVESVAKGTRGRAMTLSAAVNKMLRDLRTLTTTGGTPPAAAPASP